MTKLAENETNIRNLEPDILLLRALILDFIERYDKFVEALLAWHEDEGSRTKPRKIIDIADAGRLIDMCSKLIYRQHQIEQTGAISLQTFRQLLGMMGMAVAQVVKDQVLLGQIEQKWAGLVVDNKPSDHEPLPDDVIDAEVADGE